MPGAKENEKYVCSIFTVVFYLQWVAKYLESIYNIFTLWHRRSTLDSVRTSGLRQRGGLTLKTANFPNSAQ